MSEKAPTPSPAPELQKEKLLAKKAELEKQLEEAKDAIQYVSGLHEQKRKEKKQEILDSGVEKNKSKAQSIADADEEVVKYREAVQNNKEALEQIENKLKSTLKDLRKLNRKKDEDEDTPPAPEYKPLPKIKKSDQTSQNPKPQSKPRPQPAPEPAPAPEHKPEQHVFSKSAERRTMKAVTEAKEGAETLMDYALNLENFYRENKGEYTLDISRILRELNFFIRRKAAQGDPADIEKFLKKIQFTSRNSEQGEVLYNTVKKYIEEGNVMGTQEEKDDTGKSDDKQEQPKGEKENQDIAEKKDKPPKRGGINEKFTKNELGKLEEALTHEVESVTSFDGLYKVLRKNDFLLQHIKSVDKLIGLIEEVRNAKAELRDLLQYRRFKIYATVKKLIEAEEEHKDKKEKEKKAASAPKPASDEKERKKLEVMIGTEVAFAKSFDTLYEVLRKNEALMELGLSVDELIEDIELLRKGSSPAHMIPDQYNINEAVGKLLKEEQKAAAAAALSPSPAPAPAPSPTPAPAPAPGGTLGRKAVKAFDEAKGFVNPDEVIQKKNLHVENLTKEKDALQKRLASMNASDPEKARLAIDIERKKAEIEQARNEINDVLSHEVAADGITEQVNWSEEKTIAKQAFERERRHLLRLEKIIPEEKRLEKKERRALVWREAGESIKRRAGEAWDNLKHPWKTSAAPSAFTGNSASRVAKSMATYAGRGLWYPFRAAGTVMKAATPSIGGTKALVKRYFQRSLPAEQEERYRNAYKTYDEERKRYANAVANEAWMRLRYVNGDIPFESPKYAEARKYVITKQINEVVIPEARLLQEARKEKIPSRVVESIGKVWRAYTGISKWKRIVIGATIASAASGGTAAMMLGTAALRIGAAGAGIVLGTAAGERYGNWRKDKVQAKVEKKKEQDLYRIIPTAAETKEMKKKKFVVKNTPGYSIGSLDHALTVEKDINNMWVRHGLTKALVTALAGGGMTMASAQAFESIGDAYQGISKNVKEAFASDAPQAEATSQSTPTSEPEPEKAPDPETTKLEKEKSEPATEKKTDIEKKETENAGKVVEKEMPDANEADAQAEEAADRKKLEEVKERVRILREKTEAVTGDMEAAAEEPMPQVEADTTTQMQHINAPRAELSPNALAHVIHQEMPNRIAEILPPRQAYFGPFKIGQTSVLTDGRWEALRVMRVDNVDRLLPGRMNEFIRLNGLPHGIYRDNLLALQQVMRNALREGIIDPKMNVDMAMRKIIEHDVKTGALNLNQVAPRR